MKTIKLTDNIDFVSQQALKVLKNHGVIVTPSETQYGLAADPTSQSAVRKILAIKKRSLNNPLPLAAGSQKIINDYFVFSKAEQIAMNKFWPGPVSLRLTPKNNDTVQTIARLTLGNKSRTLQRGIKPRRKGGYSGKVRDKYTNQQPKANQLVIRWTAHKLLADLSNRLKLPIIATSANISGQPACYDIDCVKQQFKENGILPDLIIDAGSLPHNPPSTIIDLTQQPYKILRPGARLEEVKKFLDTLFEINLD